jgi:hypothetical protein
MFQEWFATSPVASWLRSFIAIVVAMFIADGADLFAVELSDLRSWVAAGLAATLPVIVRWLNPADVEYGRGAISYEPFDIFDDEDDK